jgi:ubiquinone/menaquinone biosynthesis C-methylase UbiE
LIWTSERPLLVKADTQALSIRSAVYLLNEESFDVVLLVQVFEYLEDVQKVLLELHRVLKPGRISTA